MKELLTQYLKHYYNYDIVVIDYFNVCGADCNVLFYNNNDEMYRERTVINIWDMLVFLNTNKL